MIASHRLFEAYRAAATEVLSTVEADSATATMLMTDVDEQFAQLSADLDGYRSRADAVSQALSRDAMRAADRERLLLCRVRDWRWLSASGSWSRSPVLLVGR
jgi:hypothetical protein